MNGIMLTFGMVLLDRQLIHEVHHCPRRSSSAINLSDYRQPIIVTIMLREDPRDKISVDHLIAQIHLCTALEIGGGAHRRLEVFALGNLFRIFKHNLPPRGES